MTPEAKLRRREKRERKHAEYRAATEALKAAGKFCSNCQEYEQAPTGIKGRICALQSDSDGYVVVQPGHTCPSHSSTIRQSAPALGPSQNTAERLPSSDAAEAGADTRSTTSADSEAKP